MSQMLAVFPFFQVSKREEEDTVFIKAKCFESLRRTKICIAYKSVRFQYLEYKTTYDLSNKMKSTLFHHFHYFL